MIIKTFIKQAPVIGSAYGFTQTAIKVTNCTTPSGAVVTACRSIIIDCTPPVRKYPLLCASLLTCSAGAICTGNPLMASAAIQVGEAIIEDFTS